MIIGLAVVMLACNDITNDTYPPAKTPSRAALIYGFGEAEIGAFTSVQNPSLKDIMIMTGIGDGENTNDKEAYQKALRNIETQLNTSYPKEVTIICSFCEVTSFTITADKTLYGEPAGAPLNQYATIVDMSLVPVSYPDGVIDISKYARNNRITVGDFIVPGTMAPRTSFCFLEEAPESYSDITFTINYVLQGNISTSASVKVECKI